MTYPIDPQLVSCERREDGVAVVTLTNGRRRNSITVPMVEELVATLDAIEADTAVGAIVITGEAPAFCAGADLTHLTGAATGDAGAERSLRSVYEGFRRVQRCAKPTVAAVNGAAVGAGMNLALATDVRVAGESALFATRFLGIGLHPGGGHTWMLRNAIGLAAANAVLLFGQDLDGAAAARIGLAWECVPDDRLLERSIELAAVAASAPHGVAAAAKASVREMADVTTYDEAIEVEIVKQLWSAAQPDFLERMAALKAEVSRGRS